ncbi:protein of unknown function [Nitrospira japonica]|uniref:Uncharacterized protein n=1 Tax=Nitrospira japonica TaxID=1325564 RepID=A0A1W1I627_9BACT|nr:protein of unknown function [Nitrospira japonica]
MLDHSMPSQNGRVSGEVSSVVVAMATAPLIVEGGVAFQVPDVVGENLVPPIRIERTTRGLGNRCSIQLSYGGMVEYHIVARSQGQALFRRSGITAKLSRHFPP